jgi:hypothetical protein
VTEDLRVLWGARNIGKAIGRSQRETYYLLEHGMIEAARKVGEQWTADLAGLRKQFCSSGSDLDRLLDEERQVASEAAE